MATALDTVNALVIVLDAEGKILYFNRACEQTSGYSATEVIERYYWDLLLHRQKVEVLKANFVKLKTGQFPDRYEDYWLTKAQKHQLIAWSHNVLRNLDGNVEYIIATGNDLTERQQTERYLTALHRISQVLAESHTLSAAIPLILPAIGESLGWVVGEFWNLDSQAKVLRCRKLWHSLKTEENGRHISKSYRVNISKFEQMTRQITFSPGVGLPGRIWASGEPTWIVDLEADTYFLRAEIAKLLGLHGVFGFPIFRGQKIFGVTIFFSHKIQQPDPELLKVMATIGKQLSQFIKRRQAEKALQESLSN